MTRLALFIAGLVLCCLHCAGPARADTTSSALAVLCPGRQDLAEPVRAASRKYLIHPVELVALVKSESPKCDPNAVNARTGATGLTQILPTGSANPQHLSVEALKNPATNLDLGARHLAGMLVLCGSLGGAVHVYHGHRTCSGWQRDAQAWKVIGYVRKFWRAMTNNETKRS